MSEPKAPETENEAAKSEEELDEKALDGVAGGAAGRNPTRAHVGPKANIEIPNIDVSLIPHDPNKLY